MVSKKVGVVVGVALFCAMVVFPLTQHQAEAQESRVVQIYTSAGPDFKARVEPQELWVRPGTAVIWTNWSRLETSVSFPAGKECGDATLKALGWEYRSDKGCLITTQYLPFGGTASLVFQKPGKYDYEIIAGAQSVIKGSILVRTFP